ncbi:MAG: hypothetical protein H6658_04715 [Ardenticatenaceae bacterium]|nr:hypothetical protein [Ardenticatenaceae bacterium]
MSVEEKSPCPKTQTLPCPTPPCAKWPARDITEAFVAEIDDFINPAKLLPGVVEKNTAKTAANQTTPPPLPNLQRRRA